MADIILKNANGTPQLYSGVTKINVPTSDGGIATYSEGGGIEEVTELPEATAENVGKIYKYQGQLYECKEIVDVVTNDNGDIASMFSVIGFTCYYHFVDNEPNIENMLVSSIEMQLIELYVLPNGTNAWILIDEGEGAVKLTFEQMFECTLNGVCNDFKNIPNDTFAYLLRYYDIELVNMDTYGNTVSTMMISPRRNLVFPKRIFNISELAVSHTKEIIFQGNIFSIIKIVLFNTPILDFTNNLVVPELSNKISSLGEITEIRVPNALLEEWKAATNWSVLADKMVGV